MTELTNSDELFPIGRPLGCGHQADEKGAGQEQPFKHWIDQFRWRQLDDVFRAGIAKSARCRGGDLQIDVNEQRQKRAGNSAECEFIRSRSSQRDHLIADILKPQPVDIKPDRLAKEHHDKNKY